MNKIVRKMATKLFLIKRM